MFLQETVVILENMNGRLTQRYSFRHKTLYVKQPFRKY